MLIRDLSVTHSGTTCRISARVLWEFVDRAPQTLYFEVEDGPSVIGDAPADACLCACFPIAVLCREPRIRIDAAPCPMLVEGLLSAHAWWTRWGGMPSDLPRIETDGKACRRALTQTPSGAMFLSGGIDGLHSLWRNRQLYRPDDLAYVRKAVFIHGFDIGKRRRNREEARFENVRAGLRRIADEVGLHLTVCRSNLRHLFSSPGFWMWRQNGSALAAVGHAATAGPTMLFIGSSDDIVNAGPGGSHPVVDPLFSSQRLRIIHDGARFARLEKVRELIKWPTAVDILRVCPAEAGDRPNCGRCEKCLRTRLELLIAGIDRTPTLGPSLTPVELWDDTISVTTPYHAKSYESLLAPLRAKGHGELCRVLESKIAAYRERTSAAPGWSAV